jgi:hypothetical protein
MPATKSLLILPILLLLSFSAQAERLTIPGHFDANSVTVMPKRGSNMDRVLADFGEPIRRIEPVGEPPITEWDYGDFRVYFEYNIVLHSVDLTTLIMPQ